MSERFDFVVVGSGFGGSVSALRLSQKGYRVLVVEKGRRWAAKDFAKTNWNLKRWMWLPALGCRGIFRMTFFRHVTVLSGVGVGGGSLVYANTLPVPKESFFQSGSWKGLAPWKDEMGPHYATAQTMLGATPYPRCEVSDDLLAEVGADMGMEGQHHPTDVAVFFGEPGETVSDPFFEGKGPERAGCTFCGACMTGCRENAKNTLDRNYLYLAEREGAQVQARTEIEAVRPLEGGGYRIEATEEHGWWRRSRRVFEAEQVVFAGGVLGTMPLLLAMQEDPQGLPKLSTELGKGVRTNNEALLGVVAPGAGIDFTKGVAITSILHTGADSHVEPVRYSRGSGFFRLLIAPHAPGANLFARGLAAVKGFLRRPLKWARIFVTPDFSRFSIILLYMQTLESTLTVRLGRGWRSGFRRALATGLEPGQEAPKAFLPQATEIAERMAEKVDGVTMNLMTETLLNIPSTAHILGGACMGADASSGVIDHRHRVFGYEGLYVVDGSSVSANPGVNPSLTITALAERAMSFIPNKVDAAESSTAPKES